MSRLPNFFLAGAPKSGTTSLYHYLDQHPDVFLSANKEPHFFADEIRAENCAPEVRRHIDSVASGPMPGKAFGEIVPEWNDYLRLFEEAGDKRAVGEASVCYLWSETAPQRIAARIPAAKIVVMLRDPAERAFSQYLHGFGNGAIRWSFREHVRRNLEHGSGQICIHYPFLEFGLYSGQLERFQRRFGGSVWIGFHEDLKSRPRDLLRSLFQFLGVDPEFAPDMSHRYLEAQVPRVAAVAGLKRLGFWRAAARITPARFRPLIRRALVRPPGTTRLDPADRRFLVEYYREDIGRLAAMLGRNLDSWLRAD